MKYFISILSLLFFFQSASAQTEVKISGAMKNVMHKGQLYGTIKTDTIAHQENLYGIGPIEYLKGEILIMDGDCYISKVGANGEMLVQKTTSIRAPFFVYANVTDWKEVALPDSVHDLIQLENYLNVLFVNTSEPVAFKLSSTVESAQIHIVNLPDGIKVSSPEQAHKGQVTYSLKNENCSMIGFYSTKHQGIFTHHDSFIHVHLINQAKNKMGHLEEVNFKNGTTKLFIAE